SPGRAGAAAPAGGERPESRTDGAGRRVVLHRRRTGQPHGLRARPALHVGQPGRRGPRRLELRRVQRRFRARRAELYHPGGQPFRHAVHRQRHLEQPRAGAGRGDVLYALQRTAESAAGPGRPLSVRPPTKRCTGPAGFPGESGRSLRGRRAAVVQRLPGARRPHPPDRCSFTPLSKLAVPRTKVSRNCQSSWRIGIQIRCPGGIAMTGLRRVVLEPNSPWGSLAVLVTLAVATGATYKTGGTVNVFPHLFYIPVVLGGYVHGLPGGIAVGVVAGLLCGPLMPLDVAAGIPQPLQSWLIRMAFFTAIGALT